MRVELRDPWVNLFPDDQVAPEPCRTKELDVARGGVASAHLLLNGLTPGTTVRVALRSRGANVKPAQWYRLVDVPVEENTGPGGFTESLTGQRNEYVIRRAPFRVYDAMEPVGSAMQALGATMALRVQVPIDRAARAGRRAWTVEVQYGRERTAFRLDVRVHRAVLPEVGRESFPCTNWFSFDHMAGKHGLKPWSEGHWGMIRRYAELMVHGRQNMFWIPLRDVFHSAGGKLMLDTARLRRIVKLFTDAGMYWIEGGQFGGRTTESFESPTFSTNFGKHLAASPAGAAEIATVARQLMAEIAGRGWRQRWVQHVADEPVPENFADYRAFACTVRKFMPGVPILEALGHPGMPGAVDLWCPNHFLYEKHREAFEQMRRDQGDQIWYYCCCCPGGLWMNRFLDFELLRSLLMGWAAALYDLDGFLHWGLNHYQQGQDPFKKNVVVEDGKTKKLPAGDTHIVYPGPDGPWSSLRLEAQREGFEDLEVWRQAKRRDRRKAETLLRRAVRGFKDYSRDVAEVRAVRRAALEMIG